MNNLFYKEYLDNISDLINLSKNKRFNTLMNKVNNEYTTINSHLIHKENKISNQDQFIFNLDMYISFVKNILFLPPLEIRYIIDLTIYNRYNKILFDNEYYYDNPNKYIDGFKKMLICNYKYNVKLLKIKEMTFDELMNYINTHKKRPYIYFERINQNNMAFISSLYNKLN